LPLISMQSASGRIIRPGISRWATRWEERISQQLMKCKPYATARWAPGTKTISAWDGIEKRLRWTRRELFDCQFLFNRSARRAML
jgi:hypothetical protein